MSRCIVLQKKRSVSPSFSSPESSVLRPCFEMQRAVVKADR